jgi:hypothetical protein
MPNPPKTYLGSLDDFAGRRKIGQPITSVGELNDELIFAILLKQPLLINDGYVLMNQGVRDAIASPRQSPFRDLVRSKFITILSRNGGSLPTLANTMAETNITSAQRLIADPYYQESYLPCLEEWSQELTDIAWYRSWPNKRTDIMFKELSSITIDALRRRRDDRRDERSRFRGEINCFADKLGDRIGSRTAWEDTTDTLLGTGVISQDTGRLLMTAANEAYQYSWGSVLLDKDNPVHVQTAAGQFFESLDLAVGIASDQIRQPVKIYRPDLNLVKKGIKNRWDVLADITHEDHPVYESKQQFLGMLVKYHTDSTVSESDMDDAAKRYSIALAKAFGKDEKAALATDLTIGAMSIAAGVLVLGPAGIGLGIGFTLAGLAGAHVKPVHNAICRLGQVKPKKLIKGESAPPFASESTFRLDPDKVTPILKKVPAYQPET